MNKLMNSTKILIINTLSSKFPLTLNQIFTYLKKNKTVTYQAAHKASRELVEENIVEKIDKQYLLNKNWVADQTKLFSEGYSNYFNVAYNPNQIDEKNKIQIFRFNSLKEITDFLFESFLQGYLTKEDSKEIYISLRRLHPIISPSVIPFLKKVLKEYKIYAICRSNKFADKWTAKFYRSLGVKVKTGVNIPHQNTICAGNCILQYFVFFDETYKKKIHNFSDSFKEKSTSNILKLTSDIFYKKAQMYIILNRYPVFVKDIKEAMKKEFE